MSTPVQDPPAEGENPRRPVEPSPAATLVLLREGPGGGEVLLLRRPADSTFAPDAWVFPGGRVDPADRELDHTALAVGAPATHWAATLGIDDPREAAAYVVTALRETFEETGILLAGPQALDPAATLLHLRRELLAGAADLAALLLRAGIRLDTRRIRYLGRWITPEWLHRRYDTRFFLARVPADARCTLEGEEIVDFRWLRPAHALEAEADGLMKLLPPTIHTLRSLDDTPLDPS